MNVVNLEKTFQSLSKAHKHKPTPDSLAKLEAARIELNLPSPPVLKSTYDGRRGFSISTQTKPAPTWPQNYPLNIEFIPYPESNHFQAP